MKLSRTTFTALVSLALVVVLGACEPTPNQQLGAPTPSAAAIVRPDTPRAIPATVIPVPEPDPDAQPAPQAAMTVEQIIEKHFGSATGSAMKIVRCESGFNPSARSHTNDHGLFQINQVHRNDWVRVTGHSWADRYDAELNTIFAKRLYDQQGWGPWTCKKVL